MKKYYVKKEKKIKNNVDLKKINLNNKFLINLFKSKNHLGHLIKNSNSKSFKYLYGTRFGQSIINLEYTTLSIKRCFLIINKILLKRKNILIVINDFKIDFLRQNLLSEIQNNKYKKQIKILSNSWVDGFFTKKNSFYEKNDISLIISFCNKNNDFLIKESIISNIPLISFTDTNKNPDLITYPIISNNNNIKSLFFFFFLLKNFLKTLK